MAHEEEPRRAYRGKWRSLYLGSEEMATVLVWKYSAPGLDAATAVLEPSRRVDRVKSWVIPELYLHEKLNELNEPVDLQCTPYSENLKKKKKKKKKKRAQESPHPTRTNRYRYR